jgi:hypothetical protein
MQDESFIAIEHFDPFLLILVLPSCDKRGELKIKGQEKSKHTPYTFTVRQTLCILAS